MPTPPPTRIGRRPSRGGANPIPNGPAIHRPSPVAQLAEPVRAGPDVLEHEVQPAAFAAHHAERARQERALVRSPAPALGRGEHVELARVGLRPVRVVADDDVVGADAPVLADLGEPAAERRERPAHAWTPLACSSCSDTTGGSPTRAAAIARAAAIPPAIVVMHGDAARDGGAADLVAVRARGGAGRRVDHEVDVAAVDPVDDVRRAVLDLVDRLDRDAHPLDRRRRCRAWRRSGSRGRAAGRRCPSPRTCRSR